MLEVTVDDKGARKHLEGFFTDLRRQAAEAIGDAAQASLERIVNGAYWTNRSRKTEASFQVRQRGEFAFEVYSSSKVAGFLNNGTKPHPIVPKAAKGFEGPLPKGQGRRSSGQARQFLRFVANGQVRFARRVMHPGTKALGFEAIEAQRGQADAERLVQQAAERAVQNSGVGG